MCCGVLVSQRQRGDSPVWMIFLNGIMMKKIKIKSVMRLILFLIAFWSCTFCRERKTKDDMLETYSILKSTDLSDFSGWRILERGNKLIFVMYYEHKDSTSHQYTSSGSILPRSKYRNILFYLNEDLDSLYWINNKDTTLQFDDGVEFLSHHSDQNELKSNIKSNYENFKRLGLKEVFGYPWANIYDFQLGPCIELKKVGGEDRNEDFLTKRGYVKLDSNWYYLIDATCQQ
jgi:hypothetical protein